MKKIFTAAILILSIHYFTQNAFAFNLYIPPLIEAIQKKERAKVELLINQGENVNVAHEDTALVTAIDINPGMFDIEIVKMLLNAKGIDVNR